jgi:hypothetical protein
MAEQISRWRAMTDTGVDLCLLMMERRSRTMIEILEIFVKKEMPSHWLAKWSSLAQRTHFVKGV